MKSYNGWTASPTASVVHLTPLVVAGVSFAPGVRAGDVHTVLGYVAEQFDKRVEKLVDPGCWGYAYRKNRNADNLSCHASATAIDCNAPKHPNGVATAKTFSPAQITEVHKILAEVNHVVVWGGDFTRTVDSMHFEIYGTAAQVAKVAKKLTTQGDDDMQLTDEISDWAPESDRTGKNTVGKTLNQCRGYAEDAFRRAKSADERVKQCEVKLDQVLALLAKGGK